MLPKRRYRLRERQTCTVFYFVITRTTCSGKAKASGSAAIIVYRSKKDTAVTWILPRTKPVMRLTAW